MQLIKQLIKLIVLCIIKANISDKTAVVKQLNLLQGFDILTQKMEEWTTYKLPSLLNSPISFFI